MKDKLTYESLINTLYNILERKNLRVLIRSEVELSILFKKNIENMFFLENILQVEKNNSKAKEFAIIFSKIKNKKVEYEIADDASLENVEKDLNSLKNFVLKNTNILKQDLENEVSLFKFKKIKEELVDDNKQETIEQTGNINVAETAIIQNNNENVNKTFNNFNGTMNIDQKNLNSIFTLKHPLQDPRFYPYKTKPKTIKYLKIGLAASLLAWIIIFSILQLIAMLSSAKINADSKQQTITIYMISLNSLKDNFIPNVFSIILYLFLGFYIALLLFKKPKIYREQYHIPGFLLFIIGFLIIIMFCQLFIGQNSFIKVVFSTTFSSKELDNLIQNFVKENFKNVGAPDQAAIASSIKNALDFKLFDAFGMIFVISSILFVIAFFITLFSNPQLDKEKIQRAISEWQKKSAYTLMNQQYEMDESLYEPQSVIDEFNEKNKKEEN
ncbi:hypothetical protein [Spiroplasma endosymbiont of Crioceris asparagi]|uniref:hypothetical protein n=1 Tax=Spiroplasma endosymbiont of Crioceris asparagi TaxID=3066286 RepID=UPI0030CC98DC